MSVYKPSKPLVTVSIDYETRQILRRLAYEQESSMIDVLRVVVREAAARHDATKEAHHATP